MMSNNPNEVTFMRRIRSFVVRDGRMTDGQRQALKDLWPQFGLNVEDGLIDLNKVFGREALCFFEIGFGAGNSLLEIAKQNPDMNFIGVEMHQPGIGNLLLNMRLQNVNNIRIYYADAVEVMLRCIPEASLDGVQIFFPDPWQKRRHHKRRLIQPGFVSTVAEKLKKGGLLHLATDWENYAEHMMRVLSDSSDFTNLAAPGQFADRSANRPITTKFELRGLRSGRQTWELQFTRR